MRTFIIILMLVVAAPAMMITTGGCGGGGTPAPMGGGGTVISGPSDADFFGGYFWQFLSCNPGIPECTSQWGIMTADGAGSINAGAIAQNQAGVVTGPVGIPPLPYTVNPDGTIELTIGPSTLNGGITEDGAIMAVAQNTPGFHPTIAIMPRGVGVYNDASLNGEYHYCAFWFNGASGNEVAHWGGTVTFDGVGGAFNYSAGSTNVNGAVAPPQPPMNYGAYNVAANGLVEWFHPGSWMTGGLGFGGDLMVLTGSTNAGEDRQRVEVLIRKGAGLSDASLSGTYRCIVIGADDAPPPRYFSYTGTVTFDGAGGYLLGEGQVNRDGVILPQPAAGAPSPYSVSADGTLEVNGTLFQGGVSPDGRVAVWSGPNVAGNPQLWFCFK